MRKAIKITLFTVCFLLILIFIAGFVASRMIDQDDMKQKLSEYVDKKTGRTLTVNGDLSLSVFPQVHVTFNDVTLSNPEGFSNSDFATASKLTIDMSWGSLIKGNVNADELSAVDLVLNLQKNANGDNNWKDFLPDEKISKPSKASTEENPDLANEEAREHQLTFGIDKIKLQNATINFVDKKTGEKSKLFIKSLDGSGINFDNQRFSLSSQFQLDHNGTPMLSDMSLSSGVTVNLADQQYQLDDTSLKGNMGYAAASSQTIQAVLSGALQLDLKKKTLQLSSLSVDSKAIKGSGNIDIQLKEKGQPNIRIEGKTNITQLNLQMLYQLSGGNPLFKDLAAFQSGNLSFDFKGDHDFFALNALKGKLDDTSFQGELLLRHALRPRLNFQLALDQINLDNYSAASTTPTKTNTKRQTATSNSTMTYNTNPKPSKSMIIEGDVKIKTLTTNNITLSGVTAILKTDENDNLIIRPFNATLYSGRAQGELTLTRNTQSPSFQIRQSLSNINMQALTQDLKMTTPISGTGFLTMNLSARGSSAAAIKKSLGGNLNLNIRQGRLEQLDVPGQLVQTYDKYSNTRSSTSSSKQTNFSAMGGNFSINKGIASTNNLHLDSDMLDVKGKGTANLVSEKLHFKMEAVINSPGFSQVEQLQTLAGGSIPLIVTGTFSHPKIEADYRKMLTRITQIRLGKQIGILGDQIQDKAGNLGGQVQDLGNTLQDNVKSLFGR